MKKMYKTFAFDENAPREILTALVRNNPVGSFSDALNFILFEQKYDELTSDHLKRFLEEVFWASTLSEERNFHLPSVSLAPLTSIIEKHFGVGKKYKFLFAEPLVFEAKILAKLATALEGTEHHIGTWVNERGELEVWGFTTASEFIAKAVEVGQILLIKRGTDHKVERKILIDSLRIAFVRDLGSNFPVGRKNIFIKLVAEMRNHQHGGTLLAVSNSKTWKKSIDSATYFNQPNQSLVDFTDELIAKGNSGAANKLRSFMGEKHLKLLGRITAPDGATVVNQKLEIFAFGAKIKPKPENDLTEVLILEPFEDSEEKTEELSKLGGTRHQSAARFVSDQQNNSFAVVASQDGKVSVMHWDKKTKMVRVIQHAEYLFV